MANFWRWGRGGYAPFSPAPRSNAPVAYPARSWRVDACISVSRLGQWVLLAHRREARVFSDSSVAWLSDSCCYKRKLLQCCHSQRSGWSSVATTHAVIMLSSTYLRIFNHKRLQWYSLARVHRSQTIRFKVLKIVSICLTAWILKNPGREIRYFTTKLYVIANALISSQFKRSRFQTQQWARRHFNKLNIVTL